MNTGRVLPWLSTLCLTLLMQTGVSATIVLIEYEDRNGVGGFPDHGGPHWQGFVDTVADTLTIQSWTDLPGTPAFWTPLWTPDLSAFPLVWPAVNAEGAPYDVPDDFLGVITSAFAFISPISARNMLWNEGQWGVTAGFELPPEADYFPGWGGVREPVNVGGVVSFVYDTSADETSMPLLPISSLGLAESTGATVTARVAPNVESIPEASSFLLGGLVAAASGISALWRRRGEHAAQNCRTPA